MNPMEHKACLAFADTWGWPEWNVIGKDYTKHEEVKKESLRGDGTAWEIFDFIDGKWNVCGRTVFNSVARALWIVWLMEEAARLNEGSMLKIELSKAPPCFVQMWQAHGVGGSPLLALLDAVSQVKRKEAGK